MVILAAGFALWSYRNKETKQPEQPAQKQPEKQTVQVIDKKITDKTKPFDIDVTYPEIAGADGFNKAVKSFIDKDLAEFKQYSLENDKAVKEPDPESYAKYPREYNFDGDYEKGQIDENIASVMLSVYSFTGGAHGSEIDVPIN